MFLRHSSPTTMSLAEGHFAAQAKGFNAGRLCTRLQVRTVLKSPRQGNASFESKMQNVPVWSIAEHIFPSSSSCTTPPKALHKTSCESPPNPPFSGMQEPSPKPKPPNNSCSAKHSPHACGSRVRWRFSAAQSRYSTSNNGIVRGREIFDTGPGPGSLLMLIMYRTVAPLGGRRST